MSNKAAHREVASRALEALDKIYASVGGDALDEQFRTVERAIYLLGRAGDGLNEIENKVYHARREFTLELERT